MKDSYYVQAYNQANYIIQFSLKSIEKWEYDFQILEELLRINHRGWELLLKTFRHSMNGRFHGGHSLINQILMIKKEGLFWVKLQNLDKLFSGPISMDYFRLLDDLFDDTQSRYAHVNDFLGKASKHHLIDSWVKNHKLDKDPNKFCETTKEVILEINMINMRYIYLHFSQDPSNKKYSSIFGQYGSYFNEKFK